MTSNERLRADILAVVNDDGSLSNKQLRQTWDRLEHFANELVAKDYHIVQLIPPLSVSNNRTEYNGEWVRIGDEYTHPTTP